MRYSSHIYNLSTNHYWPNEQLQNLALGLLPPSWQQGSQIKTNLYGRDISCFCLFWESLRVSHSDLSSKTLIQLRCRYRAMIKMIVKSIKTAHQLRMKIILIYVSDLITNQSQDVGIHLDRSLVYWRAQAALIHTYGQFSFPSQPNVCSLGHGHKATVLNTVPKSQMTSGYLFRQK